MISPGTGELLKNALSGNGKNNESQESVTFEVNRLISKTATYYEKVRYSVDYKEEHTIRRSAIERILRRKLLIEGEKTIGLSLLSELVSGQYISEQYHNVAAGEAIGLILSRFLLLYTHAGKPEKIKKKIISLAATEIDHWLDASIYQIDWALTESFYARVKPFIQIEGRGESDMEIYSACVRSLLGGDNEMLLYALWGKFVPTWKTMSELEVIELGSRVGGILSNIDELVKSSLQWQIAQKIKNEAVYFLILRELLRQYGKESESVLTDPEKLQSYVKNFLDRVYKKENTKIRSRGIRAIIYLFCTKVILALALELPYEVVVLGAIQPVPLTINILFPPVLLFILTRGVRTLDARNTSAIIEGVQGTVAGNPLKQIHIREKNPVMSLIFLLLYTIFLGILLGIIISVLIVLHFNPVSIVLFIFFLALVSYFAFRVRFTARRWQVVSNDGIMTMMGGVLALPIVNLGRWLSRQFSSVNVLVLILDFIVETPFKFVLNFSNEFISYLKEKSEELR